MTDVLQGANGAADERRRLAMGVLAQATCQEIADGLKSVGAAPEATLLRGPETGLVMLRGRIGGGGAPFNFGEATVTRASVKLASGEIGHSYCLGRDAEKSRLSAVVDALMQRDDMRDAVSSAILAPVEARIRSDQATRRAKVAATRVDFFTLVRGDD